ncbi:MAG: cupin fold metalloprotein, WbuC family, partial [bacterium]|nr:cupin fold metalloprotein, WbuC family [bacterium]
HAVNYEFALVLKGSFSLLLFDDAGVVTDRQIISAGSDSVGFQIQPNQWHTLVTLEDDSVFFEVKQGPYDPQVAAEFALWSPEEGAPEVAAFVGNLCMAAVGQRVECE